MPRVLIECPNTKRRVSTGLRTPEIDLSKLQQPRAFRCTLCGEVHRWGADDALVEDPELPQGMRAANAALGAGR